MRKRKIVSFYELPLKWQREAVRNLGEELAEETQYLEPLSKQSPKNHILWDLSQCEWLKNDPDGFNAYITVSNNSAMMLKIDSNFETAVIKFV